MTTASAKLAGQGRETRWTREAVIEKIHEWVALYGEPPRASDWNPSSAKWSGQTWRIERYRAGDWPSLNAAKKAFGGSLNAAVEAAGYEPNRHGPPGRKRLEAEPELLERVEMHPLVRVALGAAQATAREAEEKLEVRERQLAIAREANANLREAVDAARRARRVTGTPRVRTKTRTKTKVKTKVVRERVVDSAAVERAKAKAARAVEAAKKATADAAEARRAASRAASKQERAEATISTLREERRELKAEAADAERLQRDAEDRVTALERLLAEARKREPIVREVMTAEAEEVEAARSEVMEATRIRDAAELRAATAEREARELSALVTGQDRLLTPAEKEELREGGPSGESVLGQALGELAAARKVGGRRPLKVALGKVASAAVRWQDRL